MSTSNYRLPKATNHATASFVALNDLCYIRPTELDDLSNALLHWSNCNIERMAALEFLKQKGLKEEFERWFDWEKI